jgi:hypothetical protein
MIKQLILYFLLIFQLNSLNVDFQSNLYTYDGECHVDNEICLPINGNIFSARLS